MTAPALDVLGLVKCYSGRRVVDELSLQVRPGTVLALLGPNGAGKTTTVEVCQGFRRADAGTVRVLGLSPRDPALRPRIGVMPQAGGAYPGLRCGEMLRLVASYAAHPLDPANLLDRLGLQEVARTPAVRTPPRARSRAALHHAPPPESARSARRPMPRHQGQVYARPRKSGRALQPLPSPLRARLVRLGAAERA